VSSQHGQKPESVVLVRAGDDGEQSQADVNDHAELVPDGDDLELKRTVPHYSDRRVSNP
jgi:hypothetical protein